jgi:hypothetical protein
MNFSLGFDYLLKITPEIIYQSIDAFANSESFSQL